jgi:hypothetical protein
VLADARARVRIFWPQAFEDEDFLDPDTDTRLTKLIGMRAAKPADGAAMPMDMPFGGGGGGAGPSGAQAPPSGSAAPPRGTKRPRSPEAGAAGGAGPSGAGAPPAQRPRVLDQEAAAQLAAIEADCGITLAQFTDALTSGPPPSMTVRPAAALRACCARVWLSCPHTRTLPLH